MAALGCLVPLLVRFLIPPYLLRLAYRLLLSSSYDETLEPVSNKDWHVHNSYSLIVDAFYALSWEIGNKPWDSETQLETSL